MHAEVHNVESMLNVVMLSAVITECHFFIVMLNAILLSVGMMNVIMLRVIWGRISHSICGLFPHPVTNVIKLFSP